MEKCIGHQHTIEEEKSGRLAPFQISKFFYSTSISVYSHQPYPHCWSLLYSLIKKYLLQGFRGIQVDHVVMKGQGPGEYKCFLKGIDMLT